MVRVTILFAGGGQTRDLEPILDRFADAVSAAGAQRVAVISGGGHDHAQLCEWLGARMQLGFALELRRDAFGAVAAPDAAELLGCDAVVISGDTPAAVLKGLEHRIVDLRRIVHEGAPYLGIDAGAAVAGEVAWLGGNAIGDVVVAPGNGGELTLGAGLGLVDLVVIPDAAASGRIGLGVAAIEAGLCDRIIGIDAHTALEASDRGLTVHGTGSVWQLTGRDDAVAVSTMRAAE